MVLLSNFLELSMKDKIIQSKEEENQALKKRIAELEREMMDMFYSEEEYLFKS